MQTVLWLQQFSFLAPLMRSASWLGTEEFFLLLLPLLYLCVSRRAGLRLGILILGCDALCGILKIAFALPRPYWIDARAATSAIESSFGFPSSHAQVAIAGWLFLARRSRRVWAIFAALLLVALIGISRVYLGVHFPRDVVAGFAFGLVFLWIFWKYKNRFCRWFGAQNLLKQIGVSALISLVILAIFATVRVLVVPNSALSYTKFVADARSFDSIVSRAGAIFGLGCGAALASRWARFQIEGSALQKIARFTIALVGVLFFWKGLALISPHSPELLAQVFRFFRYAFLTIWVTFGAPFLLLKWKLLRAPNAEIGASEGNRAAV